MTTGKVVLVTVLAGAISIGLAVLGQRWLDESKGFALQLPKSLVDKGDRLEVLPEFRLPDTGGVEVSSKAWAGKVLVLNFWATWCPPCLREMPLLTEVQQAHGDESLQVVGIAIDEPGSVQRFLADNPVGYPVLLGDTDAIEMSRRLGNRLQGLPFTAIFDRAGRRVHAQVGEVTRTSLSEHLEPLLQQSADAQTTGN
jgi:thiol-disulfide isomerase/thioredoxin